MPQHQLRTKLQELLWPHWDQPRMPPREVQMCWGCPHLHQNLSLQPEEPSQSAWVPGFLRAQHAHPGRAVAEAVLLYTEGRLRLKSNQNPAPAPIFSTGEDQEIWTQPGGCGKCPQLAQGLERGWHSVSCSQRARNTLGRCLGWCEMAFRGL